MSPRLSRRGVIMASRPTAVPVTPETGPAWQSATTGQNTANALTLNKPASTAAGDLLIFHGLGDTNTAGFTATGWTVVNQQVGADGSGRMRTAYRIADGSEGATFTFTWSTFGTWTSGVISRFTGAHATSPINVHGGQANGGTVSTTPTSPDMTTTVDGCVLYWVCCAFGGATQVTTPPPDSTKRVDYYSSNLTGKSWSATMQLGAAGAIGTKVGGLSVSTAWGVRAFALRPA